RQTFEARSLSSFPAPTPITDHLAEGSLESVIVSAAYCLEARIFINEALNLTKVFGQVIVWLRGLGPEFTKLGQASDQLIDLARPIKRITSPGRRKVPRLGESCGGVAKGIARFLRPPSPPKDASHAVGGTSEGALEPAVKGAVHEIARLIFGGYLEQRIDSCFDRTLAE